MLLGLLLSVLLDLFLGMLLDMLLGMPLGMLLGMLLGLSALESTRNHKKPESHQNNQNLSGATRNWQTPTRNHKKR